MGLVVFGIGFGLLIGAGLFALIIYPALRERKRDQRDHDQH